MATGSGGGSGGGGKGGQDVGGIFVSLGLDAAPFRNDLERAKAATELMAAQLEKLKQQAASGAIPLAECAAKSKVLTDAMRTVESAMSAAGIQTAAQAAASAKAAAAAQAQAAAQAAQAAATQKAATAQASLTSAFSGYASQSVQSVQTANAQAVAQKASNASAVAAFAAYGNLGTAQVRVATATDKASTSTRNLGYAGLQAGRALQDFTQGGIGGILNNIEGLASGLGAGAGMAGLLTAVGVAAFIAKPYLEKLFTQEAIDPFESSMERLGKRIKELTDSKDKSIIDRVELAAATEEMKRLTAAADAYNEARGFKGRYEKKSEEAVAEAVGEDKGAAEALRRSEGKKLEEKDLDLKAKRERIKSIEEHLAFMDSDKYEVNENTTDDIARLTAEKERLTTESQGLINNIYKVGTTPETQGSAQVAAGRLLRKAMPGEDVAERNEALAVGLEGAGRGALASQVRGLTPKDFKEQEQSEEGVARLTRKAAEKKKAETLTEKDYKDAEDEFYDMKKETEQLNYKDAMDDMAIARRANADEKSDAAATKAAAGVQDAARRKLMSPAAKAAEDKRRARAIIDGRAGAEGGVGAGPNAPAMPNAPAAGAGGDTITSKQGDTIIKLLETLGTNTEDMGDGATFG